jgi:hypothetical protein
LFAHAKKARAMSNLLDVHTFERRLNLLLDELAERRTILVTGGTASMDTSEHQFDHRVSFREAARPYRAVAIVGQPYHETTGGIERNEGRYRCRARTARAAESARELALSQPHLLLLLHAAGNVGAISTGANGGGRK